MFISYSYIKCNLFLAFKKFPALLLITGNFKDNWNNQRDGTGDKLESYCSYISHVSDMKQ